MTENWLPTAEYYSSWKSRSWVFTINNPDEYDIASTWELFDLYGKYMITGFEVGASGTPHIQGYIQCKNPLNRGSITRVMTRCWCDSAKGDANKNREYCSKSKLYVEFGEPPHQGKASWDKIVDAMDNPKDNMHMYNQYRKAYLDVVARDEPIEKERIIYRFPYIDRIQLMRFLKTKFGFAFLDSKVLIVNARDQYHIDEHHDYWRAGFPPLVKHGYQRVRFDPDIIIYLIDDERVPKEIKSLPEYSIVECQSGDPEQPDGNTEDR